VSVLKLADQYIRYIDITGRLITNSKASLPDYPHICCVLLLQV